MIDVRFDPHNLKNEGFHFDSFVDAQCECNALSLRLDVDGIKRFIKNVLVESVNDRPNAMECVRLLMNILYGISVDGFERQNNLERLLRDECANSTEERSDSGLVMDCLYMSLGELL